MRPLLLANPAASGLGRNACQRVKAPPPARAMTRVNSSQRGRPVLGIGGPMGVASASYLAAWRLGQGTAHRLCSLMAWSVSPLALSWFTVS